MSPNKMGVACSLIDRFWQGVGMSEAAALQAFGTVPCRITLSPVQSVHSLRTRSRCLPQIRLRAD